jgi:hypothetical protein
MFGDDLKLKKSKIKYSYMKNKNIQKIERTIDFLAYGSLLLDVCIAFITALSLLNITTGEFILVPIHYMLTAVVAMSLTSGAMLVYLRHYERIMAEILRMKYRIKIPGTSERERYTMRWKLRKAKKKVFG